MNTDFYAECLVTKAPSGADTAKKVLIAAVAGLIAAAILWVLFPISIVIIGCIFYGAYFLIQGIDVEYEYIITNGEMDIDKIIGKRKRKRLVSSTIGDYTAFGKLSEAADFSGTTVLATDGTTEGAYYADFVHKSQGDVRIIFTPNEKILDGMEVFLPRQLRIDFKKNRVRLEKNETEE